MPLSLRVETVNYEFTMACCHIFMAVCKTRREAGATCKGLQPTTNLLTTKYLWLVHVVDSVTIAACEVVPLLFTYVQSG